MHLCILFIGDSFLVANALVLISIGACRPSEYKDLETGKCKSCKACPPGFGVVLPCTETTNTKCVTCREGYFSDLFSPDSICYYCTKCGEGRKVVKQCTRYSDTQCSDCVPGYFQSTLNGNCVKCGFCPPVHTAYYPRLAECNISGVAENQQCMPNIYFAYETDNNNVATQSFSAHTLETTSSYDYSRSTASSNKTGTDTGQLSLVSMQDITTATIVALATGAFLILLIVIIVLHKKGCLFHISHNQDETVIHNVDLQNDANQDRLELQTYTCERKRSHSNSSSISSTNSADKFVSTCIQDYREETKFDTMNHTNKYLDEHFSTILKREFIFLDATEKDSIGKPSHDLNGNAPNIPNKNRRLLSLDGENIKEHPFELSLNPFKGTQ